MNWPQIKQKIMLKCHLLLYETTKRWKYQASLPASWETHMQIKMQQLELDMEQQAGSKLGNEYVKAIYITLLI